jgi:hypothetical protein
MPAFQNPIAQEGKGKKEGKGKRMGNHISSPPQCSHCKSLNAHIPSLPLSCFSSAVTSCDPMCLARVYKDSAVFFSRFQAFFLRPL